MTGASIRAPARLDAARGTVASAQTRPDIARGACGHRFHGKAPASPGFVGIASHPDYNPLPVHLIKMVAAVAFLPSMRHPVLAAAVLYVLAFRPGVTIMRIVQSQ